MEIDIGRAAESAAQEFGTPLYLYFPNKIEQRIAMVTDACAGMGIRYAVKTNPNPWLLEWFKPRIASLDVSSAGEINLAVNAGWPGTRLEFTGPAKTGSDLRAALEAGIESVVVEDISEAELFNQVCRELGKKKRILVRIAPKMAEDKFGVRLAGRVTQFGVDEDRLPDFFQRAEQLECLEIDGFHIYSGSQCLDDEALASHFLSMWHLFQKAMDMLDKPISELVFGAGMGIPYHEGDASLTLEALKQVNVQIQQEISELPFPVKSYVEIGRFLVGEAGFFVTRVIRVKESMGTKVVICDGGMNHNLGACGHMGGIGHRHYQMRLLPEKSGETEPYRVVGPLCTAIDTLARNVRLPAVSAGDFICVSCGGSYGPSSSPIFFISHSFPREVVCHSGENDFQDVTWLPEHSGLVSPTNSPVDY